MNSAESAPQCGLYFPSHHGWRVLYAPALLLSRFQRYPFFWDLPRAALRAETGPSLALGYFDIAPSALKDDGINVQTPNPGLKPS